MNRYGLLIRDRWARTAPKSFRRLESPDSFFEDLGNQMSATVDQLLPSIAGQDPAGETYLQKAGRLKAATMQAEELALAEIEWPAPEDTITDQRQEWEATSIQDAALVDWANAIEGTPFEDQLDEAETTWLLPRDFLSALATAPNPSTFLAENSGVLETSKSRRFRRHLSAQ